MVKEEKGLNVKLKSLRTKSLRMDGLEIAIGKVTEAVEEGTIEPLGPTPMPTVRDLREWYHTLLERYHPFYSPLCDTCCFCTFGRCDLTEDRKGVCGIDIRTQQGRWSLLTAITGAATHYSHAKHLYEWLMETKGPDVPINMGDRTPNECPITRVITGIIPKKLSDFGEILDYIGRELADLQASIHIGQEGSYIDFEAKALHAGLLDSLSMEIADAIQICALDFPKGEYEPPLVEIGPGTVDTSKPVILCIGHNVAPGSEIINYLEEKGLADKVEVCGICCTAHDIGRYRSKVAKIIGQISMQKRFVRLGIADVIVIDEQCIQVDITEEAKKVKAGLIATSQRAMHGLPDRTNAPVDETVKEVVEGKQVLIFEPEVVAEVAVRAAMELAPKRAKYKALPSEEELKEMASRCTGCERCIKVCPNTLPIPEAMDAAKKGDVSKLEEIEDLGCVGCGKCETECPKDIPILNLIIKAAERKLKQEKSVIRAGRGPITDYEIRMVADTWGVGIVPGCIVFAGCANYPGSDREIYEMAEELLERGYIVVATGCAAMAIARYKDEEGKTLYEKYKGIFDARGMLNLGSCVSNAHAIAAGIRLGNIFARRILRGNFAEISDYLLTRVGACAIVWGAMSQKAYSIATACNAWGIPVVLGPHGSKYRRLYLGRKEKRYPIYPIKGEKRDEVLLPEHLVTVAESKGEALTMAVKLCARHNDFEDGRRSKVANYVELSLKYLGKMPDDVGLLLRREGDIPTGMKDAIMEKLKETGWEPAPKDLSWVDLRDVSVLPPSKLWTYEAMRRGLKWFAV
ncbi:MAG: CO dehydrogenase/acetyl-CoA synthase complex subunit alpha [Candidatus Methanospirareceae archaeon]